MNLEINIQKPQNYNRKTEEDSFNFGSEITLSNQNGNAKMERGKMGNMTHKR